MINLEKIQKWADKGKIKKLIKALTSKDSNIVASVLEALGNIGGEDAVNAITALTESDNKTVRTAAIMALAKCGTAASETRLKYFLNKETDDDMHKVLREALQVYADNHKV